MPYIEYVTKRFSSESRQVIRQAEQICSSYAQQGYDLTLRQLYYQFVARGLLVNTERSYKRLGSIVNDARLAGELDWDWIVDRTRNLRSLSHWDDPADLVKAAAKQFRIEKWAEQPRRVEVWIEKDALIGVLEGACPEEDVDYFSCRGYTSQSEIWGAAQRIGQYINAGQEVVILHLGDHDPSGIDMTRDIRDRLCMFIAQDLNEADPGEEAWGYEEVLGERLTVDRIALNMAQVEQYNPPPNPAKMTDSRAVDYVNRHGSSSWELDALDPATLTALIKRSIDRYREPATWSAAVGIEQRHREVLQAVSDRWGDVEGFLTES